MAEFERLLPAYQRAYTGRYPEHLTARGHARQRQRGGGSKGALAQDEDRLLFILVYLKTNPLQTMHGLQFGLSQPQANYWIHRLLPVVQAALQELGMTPVRDGSQVATSALALEGSPERRRERPSDRQRRKEQYSGKKKAHTDKNIALVNETTGKVVYLGATEPGAKHDKKAADEAQIAYPDQATLDKDTGFQGYEPEGVLTRQPKKNPKARS